MRNSIYNSECYRLPVLAQLNVLMGASAFSFRLDSWLVTGEVRLII